MFWNREGALHFFQRKIETYDANEVITSEAYVTFNSFISFILALKIQLNIICSTPRVATCTKCVRRMGYVMIM